MSAIKTDKFYISPNIGPWKIQAENRYWDRVIQAGEEPFEALGVLEQVFKERKPMEFRFISREGKPFLLRARPLPSMQALVMECLSFNDIRKQDKDLSKNDRSDWLKRLNKKPSIDVGPRRELAREESKKEVSSGWKEFIFSQELQQGMREARGSDHHIDKNLLIKCLKELKRSGKLEKSAIAKLEPGECLQPLFHVTKENTKFSRILTLMIHPSNEDPTKFIVKTASYYTDREANSVLGNPTHSRSGHRKKAIMQIKL